tara:strand:- start:35 stop:454 length:420 start_codon:yes stop_codon:yes gene_type:complete
MKDIKNVQRGKKSRKDGADFERRVRKDLEEQGWNVDKWSNNVNLKLNAIFPAKRKYLGFGKPLVIGTGFPDFIGIRKNVPNNESHLVIGVECKTNGRLDKEEKEKISWLLKNDVFSKIYVASKTKINNRIKIEYIEILK